MATPLETLLEDHRNTTRLLDALDRQIGIFAEAGTPDYDVIVGVAEYFLDYPDLCHHPKEDAIAARLLATHPAEAAVIADLAGEHELARARARRFRRTIRRAPRRYRYRPRGRRRSGAAFHRVRATAHANGRGDLLSPGGPASRSCRLERCRGRALRKDRSDLRRRGRRIAQVGARAAARLGGGRPAGDRVGRSALRVDEGPFPGRIAFRRRTTVRASNSKRSAARSTISALREAATTTSRARQAGLGPLPRSGSAPRRRFATVGFLDAAELLASLLKQSLKAGALRRIALRFKLLAKVINVPPCDETIHGSVLTVQHERAQGSAARRVVDCYFVVAGDLTVVGGPKPNAAAAPARLLAAACRPPPERAEVVVS